MKLLYLVLRQVAGKWKMPPHATMFGFDFRQGQEEPVGGDEPKLTRALPPQDAHLMSQGDELKLQ